MATFQLAQVKSVGGGSIVGDFKGMYVTDVNGLYEKNGESWLRNGVIDDDVASYPDAKTLLRETEYQDLGEFFSTAGEMANGCASVEWDGTNFWVVDWIGDSVYKYDSVGAYTGTSISVNAQDATMQGIAWDGINFWLCGTNSNQIHKYTSAMSFISSHTPTGVTDPYGICFDGTSLWIASRATTSLVEFDLSMVATGSSLDTSGVGDMVGVSFNGGIFYISDNAGEIYRLSDAGVLLDKVLTSASANAGSTFKDDKLYVAQTTIPYGIKEFIVPLAYPYVGIQSQDTDASTGLPIYTRIK